MLRRVASGLIAVGVLALAACDTEPPTDVGYFDATVRANVGCQDSRGNAPGYDAQWRIAYRLASDTAWTPRPWHDYNCPDEQPPHYLPGSPFSETLTDLKQNRAYQYRLEVQLPSGAAFEWRDSAGTKNGTAYDGFTTDAFPTVAPKAMAALRNSVGINTRLAFSGPPGNCAETRQALAYMGIRYVRDQLRPKTHPSWPCFSLLLGDGVKGTLHALQFQASAWYINGILDQVAADPAKVNFVDVIESANEPDREPREACRDGADNEGDGLNDFGGAPPDPECASATDESESLAGVQTSPTWQARLKQFQQDLFAKVNATPALADKPVTGPSFTDQALAASVGDLSPWLDLGAFHPYPGGEKPGEHLDNGLPFCAINAGTKQCQATEVGYQTDLTTTGNWPVTESVRSNYTLRLILEDFRRGVRRTDLYTMVSQECNARGNGEVTTSDFGFHDCDWTPFPVVDAVHNFTTALGDGTPALTPLPYRVDEAPADLRQVFLRRSDGAYVVAVWRDVSIWDRFNKVALNPSPAPFKATVPDAGSVHYVLPLVSSAETAAPFSNRQLTFPLGAQPVLFVVR
jgi:hypothetical protein